MGLPVTSGKPLVGHAMRLIAATLVLIFAPFAVAQKVTLYLKDGGDLTVKKYEVVDDRVRYYSIERSSWEEIPLQYVDLEKTEREQERKQVARASRAEEDRIERAARREARTELHRVPLEHGVYYLRGEAVEPLEQAEIVVVGNKKRTLLQAIVPVFLSKSTMEIEGAESKFVVHEDKPMLYVRLEKIVRLMFVRLSDKKNKSRIVQRIMKAPKGVDSFEEQEEIEVFRQQLAPQVYKVWPVEAITPGEYALIEFTRGKGDVRAWDFSVRPASAQATGS